MLIIVAVSKVTCSVVFARKTKLLRLCPMPVCMTAEYRVFWAGHWHPQPGLSGPVSVVFVWAAVPVAVV